MLKLFVIFVLGLTYQSTFAASWEVLERDSRLQLFRLRTNPHVYAAITRRSDERIPALVSELARGNLGLLVEKRAAGMGLIGVTDWQASTARWLEDARGVQIEGNYRDHKAQPVEFIEYHFYQQEASIQILVTAPTSELARHRREIQELVELQRGGKP